MHSELIEWVVVQEVRGEMHMHSEGAQTVFGLTRAKRVCKGLGPPWEIRRINSFEKPEEE